MANDEIKRSSPSLETGSSGKSSPGAEGRFKGALDSGSQSAKRTETPSKYAGALDGGDKAKPSSGSGRYANAFEAKPNPPSEVKPTPTPAEKPPETKPKETKPGGSSGGSEVRPMRTSVEKPTGAKPVETKPGGSTSGSEVKLKPASVEKPTGAKPVETKPSGSTSGSEVKPKPTSVEKPSGTKPVETKPVETKPAGSEVKLKPASVEKPTGAKPVETKHGGSSGGSEVKLKPASVEKPSGTKPVETKPIETKPAGSEVKPKPDSGASDSGEEASGTRPVEMKYKGSEIKPTSTSVEKPTGAKPVETKPFEKKPVETKPMEAKPVEMKPVEKPFETKPVEVKPGGSEVKPGGSKIKPASAELREKGSELSAEQKDLRRREAEEELKMHTFSEETLRGVERDMESRKFRNGEGEEMRYSEAAGAMISDVDRTLTRLQTEHGREISEEQRRAMLDDMRRTLLSQQAESEARAIGNHGIPHIYGNYERLKDIPDEVYARAAEQLRERSPGSEATAEDIRMGVILACAYHDEGYLSERASTVDPETGRKEDGMHGVDSAIRFEREHAEHFAGAVDAAALDDTVMAIAQHNLLSEGSVERIESREEDNPARTEMLERIGGAEPANMDPNENFIRSALLLSDKAATDADEKMPDALRSPEAAKVLMDYYALQNSGAEGEDAAALRDQMRGRLAEVLRADESLSEEQRQRLTEALERDVDVRAGGGKGSYDFDFPMAGMATPSDAVGFSLGEDGEIEARVTLYTRVEDPLYGGIYEGDSVPAREHKPELMAKKAAGQLEDMGITGAAMEGEPTKWLTEVRDASGEAVGFAVETGHIEELSHVSVEIRDVEADNPKAKPSEIGLALEERAEELRDLELECRVQREAMREARAGMDAALASGTLTKSELISYSAQIYDEGNRDQLNAIMDRLSALEDPTREELRGIAEQLSRVHVRSYEEMLRDRARGK